ncbi:replication initiation protein [Vreelandella venusta]|uniref:replication initiation protein n=1 Tax=Vreelandella venusta TaxID=44935 RepID=UPI004044F97E
MHAIDKNSPSGSLLQFRERLPKKPYHTDDLGDGLRIRDVQKAIQARYIQANGPTHQHWLIFDVDRSGAALDWDDRGAPPPTMTVQNPTNGHAHLIYGLAVPVRTADDGRPGPLRYAAAIENALRVKLDADPGYSGLICKNPLNPFWRVVEWEAALYDLAGLESWLDLSQYSDKRKRLPDYGLGRNCNLFDRLRRWAYRAIRQGWPDSDRWYAAVLERARGYNTFDNVLNDNEVKTIARSVAKYTYRNFSAAGFSAVQAHRGRKGGTAKGMAYADKRAQALVLLDAGAKRYEVAEQLKVSLKTITNWKKGK